jgi:hypothetical protein
VEAATCHDRQFLECSSSDRLRSRGFREKRPIAASRRLGGQSVLTVLLLFLGFGTTAHLVPSAAQDEGPPTLNVEVVDPVWIPLPDSEVTVKPTHGGSSKSAHADDNGNAKFWLETGVAYTIEVKSQGFNKKTVKHVFIAKPKPASPTARVQVKLEPSGPFNYSK